MIWLLSTIFSVMFMAGRVSLCFSRYNNNRIMILSLFIVVVLLDVLLRKTQSATIYTTTGFVLLDNSKFTRRICQDQQRQANYLILSSLSSSSNRLQLSRTIIDSKRTTVFAPTIASSLSLLLSSSSSSSTTSSTSNNEDIDIDVDSLLLIELKEYLEKRKQFNADEAAKGEIGKVIGGTKGNAVLEYISGAPNKASVVDTVSNPLDYDELTKYGYGHLITPIMNNGGRIRMYKLLGLNVPPVVTTKQPKGPARSIIIDRDGSTDTSKYSGLKLTQSIDDNVQAEALARIQQDKTKSRNDDSSISAVSTTNIDRKKKSSATSNKWKSDWTVEDLDEWGKQRGKAQSWARDARDGAFISDQDEIIFDFLSIPIVQRMYSFVAATTVAIAFGQSSYTFGTLLLQLSSNDVTTIIGILQIPALFFVVGSIGSAIVCSRIASNDKKRNGITWAVKGFLGGPLTIQYLKDLSVLQTNLEQQQQQQNQ